MSQAASEKRTYAGESADARRARRREELLDSALTMLARDGREGLSVSGLCAAAGLNARYFYESFASTDEVVEALVARLADELENGFQPIARDKSLAFSVVVDERAPTTIVTDGKRVL